MAFSKTGKTINVTPFTFTSLKGANTTSPVAIHEAIGFSSIFCVAFQLISHMDMLLLQL